MSVDRRTILAGTASLALALARTARADESRNGLAFGPAHLFSFAWLRDHAKVLASHSYVAPERPVPQIVQRIDFDVAQKIKFRSEDALWLDRPAIPDPVRFFTLDKYVGEPVRIHALSGKIAREILYRPQYFDFDGTGLDKVLPADGGLTGFRVMNDAKSESDWLAFRGASYFRTAGQQNQYGASARGIAVNTALSTAEEFPRFSQFWIAENRDGVVTIYALLEGPSLTGAYKFDAYRHKGVLMDVHADLFARADIARLGIAPLTSMYWFGENDRRAADDWRPEVHDSDGLALWTGRGERIWRPLIDPPSLQTNAFVDTDPKGFGLLQRDRDFDDYQDDGAFYNRRPSIWVEPRGRWGAGAVQLVEIPTDDETHDNIVAYWLRSEPVRGGDTLGVDYRLYWQDNQPNFPKNEAYVVATRIGRGGIPGGTPRPDLRKFVIDFAGGTLTGMAPRYDIVPVVTLSRGKVEKPYVIKVVGTERWRAFFDVDASGADPLDLRCYLRLGNTALSETWLYQYFPPQPGSCPQR